MSAAKCSDAEEHGGDEELISLVRLSEQISSLSKLKEERQISLVENLDEKLLQFEKQFHENEKYLMKINEAEYWLRLGQLYSLSTKDKAKAIEPLTKAVKLNPNLFEAWNELGEIYWFNNEALKAQSSFEKALEKGRQKLPLRNLSIVLRKRSKENGVNRREYLERGIELAKEAVNLDLEDGLSWGILGNAYLSAYFGIKQDMKFTKMALSAYKQAEKLPYSSVNTELHFNKAIVSKHTELYEEALKSFDKSLCIENDWEPARKMKAELLKYLNDVTSLNLNRGKIKQKRMLAIQKDLKRIQTEPSFPEFKGVILLPFNQLKEGFNFRVIAFGKVIWNIAQEDSFPFTFGFMDSMGNAIVVTVYNMTPGRGFILGDTIMIPDPIVVVINFNYENKKFDFRSIRVDRPTQLIVNKRRLPPSWFTAFTLLTKEKDDK